MVSLRYKQLFIYIFLLNCAHAQMLVPANAAKQRIYVTIDAEPELATAIGYQHKIGDGTENTFAIGSSFKLAPLTLKNHPYKWTVYGMATINRGKKMLLQLSPQVYYAHLSDRAGQMNGIGFNLKAGPYWSGDKWTKGFTVGWQHTAFAHIRFSEEAKETFRDRYPEGGETPPTDGWFASTADRFTIAFGMGRRLKGKWNVQIEAGSILALQQQGIMLGFSHAQVPIFISGGVSYDLE